MNFTIVKQEERNICAISKHLGNNNYLCIFANGTIDTLRLVNTTDINLEATDSVSGFGYDISGLDSGQLQAFLKAYSTSDFEIVERMPLTFNAETGFYQLWERAGQWFKQQQL